MLYLEFQLVIMRLTLTKQLFVCCHFTSRLWCSSPGLIAECADGSRAPVSPGTAQFPLSEGEEQRLSWIPAKGLVTNIMQMPFYRSFRRSKALAYFLFLPESTVLSSTKTPSLEIAFHLNMSGFLLTPWAPSPPLQILHSPLGPIYIQPVH